MNAQANILRKNGILNITIAEVDKFLIRNVGNKYSSNEIYNYMPVWLQVKIQSIASSYLRGGCSSPASYVGVVASMISKNRTDYVHDYHYYCPILNRYDDGFGKL